MIRYTEYKREMDEFDRELVEADRDGALAHWAKDRRNGLRLKQYGTAKRQSDKVEALTALERRIQLFEVDDLE